MEDIKKIDFTTLLCVIEGQTAYTIFHNQPEILLFFEQTLKEGKDE